MAMITLRTIPEEVYEFLLETQGKIKVDKKVSQYSLEQTIYKLVREHKDFSSKKKSIPAK